MAKVTSLIDGEEAAATGHTSLDPSSFVDTSGWAADFGFSPDGTNPPPARPNPPPRAHVHAHAPVAHAPHAHGPSEDEIESLQQMLEPDRTGVHDTRSSKMLIAIVVVLLVVVALGTTLVLYKDQLFG
jgi:hypothetical protein